MGRKDPIQHTLATSKKATADSRSFTMNGEVCGEEEIYEYVDLRLYRVITEDEDYPDRKPFDVNGGTVMCGKCLLGGMTEVCEPVTVLSVEEEEFVRQRKEASQ